MAWQGWVTWLGAGLGNMAWCRAGYHGLARLMIWLGKAGNMAWQVKLRFKIDD